MYLLTEHLILNFEAREPDYVSSKDAVCGSTAIADGEAFVERHERRGSCVNSGHDGKGVNGNQGKGIEVERFADVACVKCEPTCVHGQIQVSFENEIGKVDAQFKRWLSPPGWKGSVVGVIDRD